MTYMDPPRVPVENLRAARPDETVHHTWLRVQLFNNGDAVLTVSDAYDMHHRVTFLHGGKSPRTLAALREMGIAMVQDAAKEIAEDAEKRDANEAP